MFDGMDQGKEWTFKQTKIELIVRSWSETRNAVLLRTNIVLLQCIEESQRWTNDKYFKETITTDFWMIFFTMLKDFVSKTLEYSI